MSKWILCFHANGNIFMTTMGNTSRILKTSKCYCACYVFSKPNASEWIIINDENSETNTQKGKGLKVERASRSNDKIIRLPIKESSGSYWATESLVSSRNKRGRTSKFSDVFRNEGKHDGLIRPHILMSTINSLSVPTAFESRHNSHCKYKWQCNQHKNIVVKLIAINFTPQCPAWMYPFQLIFFWGW